MSPKDPQLVPAVEESPEPCPGDVSTESSSIARAVERLKAASFKTAREREQVPQPLFWSLFNAQIQEIKAKKHHARVLSELFGGTGE